MQNNVTLTPKEVLLDSWGPVCEPPFLRLPAGPHESPVTAICQALQFGFGTFGLHPLGPLGAITGAGRRIGSREGFSCLVGGGGGRRTMGRDSGLVGGSRTIGEATSGRIESPHETIGGRVVGGIIGGLEGRATFRLELFGGAGEGTTLGAASTA